MTHEEMESLTATTKPVSAPLPVPLGVALTFPGQGPGGG